MEMELARNISALPLSFIFVIIFSLPSVFFVCLNQASLAGGLFAVSIVVFIYSFRTFIIFPHSEKKIALFLILCIFILVQSSYFLIEKNYSKPLYSFPILLFIFVSASSFSTKLATIDDEVIIKALVQSAYLFIFCGWVAIFFKLNIGPYSGFNKPVIPFSEESHYALCVGFLVCMAGFFANNKQKVNLFANILAQSVLFPSLTLVIFAFFAFFIFWMSKNIFRLLILGAIFALIVILLSSYYSDSVAMQYFLSRVQLNSDSDNLTTLVFLQGVDDAVRSFVNTNGLGLGFQMAGTDKVGQYGLTITKLTGSELNRTDGGFIASKLVSEFGFLGVLLLLFYVKMILTSVHKIKKLPKNYGVQDAFTALGAVCIVTFSVEFFLRGYGYFSPGIFMLLSLYGCSIKRKNIVSH
ncbi:hypothetical protein [Serratia sp. PL7]|uniref:hypothetical protein n=1 Tax=Serratia sp. PL7 TaxID=2952201 RepID=UPI0021AE23FC|nr:hypothetical protein [Serratia sp. PL7]